MATHPSKFADHEENRKKVCAICGRKIVFGSKSANCFNIREVHERLIKKYVNCDFSISDSRFPCNICGTCRITLEEYGKDNFKRTLPAQSNFSDIQLKKKLTSIIDSPCECFICSTARSTVHKKARTGRKRKNSSTRIDSSSSIKLCKNCFHEIGKGISHKCNIDKNSAQKRDGINNFIEELPQTQKEKIAHSIIKEKQAKAANNDVILLESGGGQPARVIFNGKVKKEVLFDADSLHQFKVNSGSTHRGMLKMTNYLRAHLGRNSVSKNITKKLSEKSNLLESCYKAGNFSFDTKMGKENRAVVWADAEELVSSVIDARNLVGNYSLKVSADGGQGFLKVCLSIIDNSLLEASNDKELEMIEKRTRYSEGGSASCPGNPTGVKRLYILGIVPEVKETYDNFQLLFSLIDINKISFKFVSDFKVILIVIGQQTASATHPCPYCFIPLEKLRHDSENSEENEFVVLKSFGDLKRDYEKYCALKKDKKMAKECRSTINPPLFDENNDTCVIEKCIPPELHILQGLVNQVFWNGLVPLLGREKALMWPQKLHIVSKGYHGEVFEGNDCRKLLNEADKLLDPEIYSEVGILALVPFVSVFKSMNNLVQCCFSGKLSVKHDIDRCLKELQKALLGIPTSITLKLHVLLRHIKQGLEYLGDGNGLGLWSEQAGESVHREFKKYWEKYKVKALDHPNFAERLKKAVIEFSSDHI